MDSEMKIFEIDITETYRKTYYVKAPSSEIAYEIINDAYGSGAIEVDGYCDSNIELTNVRDIEQYERYVDIVYKEDRMDNNEINYEWV